MYFERRDVNDDEAGLKKLFVCCCLTLGLRIGQLVSLVPRAIPLFDISWQQENEPSSVTIVTIDNVRLWLINTNKGIRFN